jgi:hypothetical protein
MTFPATLAGRHATSARVTIPSWGLWFADVALDGEHTLSGAADLVLSDLTLKGAILSGGPAKGRSHYRVVGGAGGWGKTIPRRPYGSDVGVRIATILSDAAREAGETLSGASSTDRVGPGYVRNEGAASLTLERFAHKGWYVDDDGTTKIGQRASSALDSAVPRVSQVDLARGTVTLAPTLLAPIKPGVVVDGLTAVDVQHEFTPKGIRSTVWGALASGTSRALDALKRLIDQLDPNRKFRGIYEYRVVTLEGSRVNLQPVRVSTGMPSLARVKVRPGVAGCEATLALGSTVGVMFFDGEPTRPFVFSFEDAEGEGFEPTMLKFVGGADFVALAAKVATELNVLKSAITSAVIVPLDGGASLKSSILTALTTWPGSVAASKVKAT